MKLLSKLSALCLGLVMLIGCRFPGQDQHEHPPYKSPQGFWEPIPTQFAPAVIEPIPTKFEPAQTEPL